MASVILGLSLNFYTRTHVNFTRVNKIEAMYGRSRVRVKVERGLTFIFTRGLSYIASISFMHVNVTCVRTEKLRVSANQPLPSRARRNTQSNTKRESTVRETDERKSNVLSCFYTCFLMLSFFFCQPGFHAPYRRLLVFFFFFFSARLRGTLIAAAIKKATGKLNIHCFQFLFVPF